MDMVSLTPVHEETVAEFVVNLNLVLFETNFVCSWLKFSTTNLGSSEGKPKVGGLERRLTLLGF